MKCSQKYNLVFSVLVLLFFSRVLPAISQQDTSKVNALVLSANDKSKPFSETIKIADSAIILADKLKYLQGKADALHIKGCIFLKIGDYSIAIESFWAELSLREKNTEWKNSSISNVYAYIGESYRAIGSFDFAESYLLKSLAKAEEEKNQNRIAFVYNRLAAVYHELSYRLPDTASSYKAVEYANKSLDMYKNLQSRGYIISNYEIIGAAYNFQASYDISLKYLFLALDYADKDTTYQDKANIYSNIASVYNIIKDYDSAIKYALKGYNLSKKQGIKVYILSNTRQLTVAYAGKGDFEKAYLFLNEANSINSQLYDEKKTSEIYGLQKKHESDLVQQEENAKTSKLKIIGLAVFLIIFIISTGIYIRHRKGLIINKELSDINKLILEQKEKLSSLNLSKDKFISILSHDIRNPLNGILGFSEILDSDYDEISEKEKREYIGYLRASSESLYKLIDRVLMWSRLQRGNLEIKKEKLNLCEVASAAVALQKANAIRKGIILENNIVENLFIETDKNVLDTVLRNLVDNAVKYTNAGGKVNVHSETKDNSIVISVSDTGVGIDQEHLSKLFEIENTVSKKGTDEEEGTGLGLTLCRDMLLLTGSNLMVESSKGNGSRFFFELPSVKF